MGGSRRPGSDAEGGAGSLERVWAALEEPSSPVRPRLGVHAPLPGSGMLLRPRRLPAFAPPSPGSPDAELRAAGDVPVTTSDAFATSGAMADPGSPKAPVSPGSAQRTPWSARETELLLGTLLQPAVWRSLLLDRRQALPTYRRVSAALARQQVRRTPAQCRRRYKFLKDKLRDSQGQPSGPFDDQIRQLMGLLGDDGPPRVRRRSAGPGRPQRRGRSAFSALAPAPAVVEQGRSSHVDKNGLGLLGRGGALRWDSERSARFSRRGRAAAGCGKRRTCPRAQIQLFHYEVCRRPPHYQLPTSYGHRYLAS